MCYLLKGISLRRHGNFHVPLCDMSPKVHGNFHVPLCVIPLKVLLFYLPKVPGKFHVSFKNILCLHFYGFLFCLSVKNISLQNTYEGPKIKLTRSKIQDIKEKMFPIFISWKSAFGEKFCYSSYIL